MAIDLAALKAKLAAQKPATTSGGSNVNSNSGNATNVSDHSDSVRSSQRGSSSTGPATGTSGTGTEVSSNGNSLSVPSVNTPANLGTAKTTEIDHLDFLAKLNSLAAAIHNQHPTMPVLLMQIHKQLRADPELVTTLDEDATGIVVRGLQIQTKTELVTAATKETKKKKNPAIDLSMF